MSSVSGSGAVRKTGVVLLIVGVICVAIEPLVTALLNRLGLLVSGVQAGWWVNESIMLGGRVSFIGQCLLAVAISALILAHFLAKGAADDHGDEQPQSGAGSEDA